MNIVIYSTNANHFKAEDFRITTFPSCADSLSRLAAKYPEHNFTVVTQLPGDFLLDLTGSQLKEKSTSVNYVITEEESAESFAKVVLEQKPDLAVAATFWTVPYDWLSAKDSLVGQFLEEQNVKVFCHPLESSLICFDKFKTHQFLLSAGLNAANAVFVHHQLFWCAGSKGKVKTNVYKECVLSQIKNLKFPLVIKDTVGLSSYGMEVVETFEEARQYLSSKRNNSDRIVEELIPGEQFGTEIYCSENTCTVLPPMKFSVNKYGITSPKLSIKTGPVLSSEYKIEELNSCMKTIAHDLKLKGVFQVDLVFKNGKWFVIEINPRLSGMSATYAAAFNTAVCEMLIDNALGNFSPSGMMHTINFKLPQKSMEELQLLKNIPEVKYVHQVENFAARQEREKGYLEVVVCSDSLEKVQKIYDDLKNQTEEA